MKVLLLCVTVLLAVIAVASASSVPQHHAASRHIMHTREVSPLEWRQGSRAAASSTVDFMLALKQSNLDQLEKMFWEVSDPKHENYQAYKSIDEINQLIAPSTAEMKQVRSWLTSHGVVASSIKSLGDALEVKTTVAHAEKLFHTQFYNFHHRTTKAKVVRSFGAYSVPASLKHLILMVSGISSFPIPHFRVPRKTVPLHGMKHGKNIQAAPIDFVLPQGIAQAYGIEQQTYANQSLGVIEFGGQYYAPQDLSNFGVMSGLNILNVSQTIGENDPTQPGDEATLDIEMAAGINLNSQTWFWSENAWLYNYGVHFFNTAEVPLVVSISFGYWEEDQCLFVPQVCSQLGIDGVGYVQRTDVEFQKIGLRGISLIAASGDSGANGRTDPNCTIAQLRPSYPAVSPYVTSVGATEFVQTVALTESVPQICSNPAVTCIGGGYEQAVSYNVSRFGSGGGFSNITDRPSYQETAVNNYLSSGVQLPPASYFNAGGRAHPDVASVGHNLAVVYEGQATVESGTSASSPIFAGVISLLNAALMADGKAQLGFLNPLLYQMQAEQPSAFTDITTGSNICTEKGCAPTCTGYLAAPGWDPVSGLGSPQFAEMLSYVSSQSFAKASRTKKANQAAHKKHAKKSAHAKKH